MATVRTANETTLDTVVRDSTAYPPMVRIVDDTLYEYSFGPEDCYYSYPSADTMGLLRTGYCEGDGKLYDQPVTVIAEMSVDGEGLIRTLGFRFTDGDTTVTVNFHDYYHACDCADPPTDVWVPCDS
jgi:hypothetical protein